MDNADNVIGVVYRGHLGYIPGFQRCMRIISLTFATFSLSLSSPKLVKVSVRVVFAPYEVAVRKQYRTSFRDHSARPSVRIIICSWALPAVAARPHRTSFRDDPDGSDNAFVFFSFFIFCSRGWGRTTFSGGKPRTNQTKTEERTEPS